MTADLWKIMAGQRRPGDLPDHLPQNRCENGHSMRRRSFVVLLVAAVIGLGACSDDGSESELFVVGFLRAVPTEDNEPMVGELRDGGFVIGDNLRLLAGDPAEAHPDPDEAKEVVAQWVEDEDVDLILAFSSTGAAAAAEVTSEVPILFLVNDPMVVGLVEDEASPEANLTGVTFRAPADRTLDLARQAIPGLTRVGVLFSSDDPAAPPARDALAAAAQGLGMEAAVEGFAGSEDVGRALDTLVAADVEAVALANSPTSIRALASIEPALTERGLPLITNVDLAETAVVALTPDSDELTAQMGRQAVRVLQGADPGNIPVEDPRKFRLILNQAQASALGLPPFPDDLVRQADRVIQ